MAHIVKTKSDLVYRTPSEFDGRSSGYTGHDVVDERGGAVQMGFRVARLDPGGHVGAPLHSFEESIYVVDGALTVDTSEGSYELIAGAFLRAISAPSVVAGSAHCSAVPCRLNGARRRCAAPQ